MQVLYFALGFAIAAILVMMMGCEKGTTDKGRECIGFAGMTIEGEQCEVIDFPPIDDPWPPVCCQALTPSCMACGEGISTDEWIEDTCGPDAVDVEYAGWNSATNEPIWLCQAVIID
tara:strand:- start:177 stop:527 length:351 start_codon:yes stop_codon:yes gene_type:complete